MLLETKLSLCVYLGLETAGGATAEFCHTGGCVTTAYTVCPLLIITNESKRCQCTYVTPGGRSIDGGICWFIEEKKNKRRDNKATFSNHS